MAFDLATVLVSVAGSGGVAYLVARVESQDRKAAIALEREKLDHEKGSTQRQRSTAVIVDALEWVEELRKRLWAYADEVRETPDRFDPSDAVLEHLQAVHDLLQRSVPIDARLAAYDYPDAYEAFSTYADVASALIGATEAWSLNKQDFDRPPVDVFDSAYLEVTAELHAVLKSL